VVSENAELKNQLWELKTQLDEVKSQFSHDGNDEFGLEPVYKGNSSGKMPRYESSKEVAVRCAVNIKDMAQAAKRDSRYKSTLQVPQQSTLQTKQRRGNCSSFRNASRSTKAETKVVESPENPQVASKSGSPSLEKEKRKTSFPENYNCPIKRLSVDMDSELSVSEISESDSSHQSEEESPHIGITGRDQRLSIIQQDTVESGNFDNLDDAESPFDYDNM
jgi:hypothetical protein